MKTLNIPVNENYFLKKFIKLFYLENKKYK